MIMKLGERLSKAMHNKDNFFNLLQVQISALFNYKNNGLNMLVAEKTRL